MKYIPKVSNIKIVFFFNFIKVCSILTQITLCDYCNELRSVNHSKIIMIKITKYYIAQLQPITVLLQWLQ